jgi:signal transduction histidine kinase
VRQNHARERPERHCVRATRTSEPTSTVDLVERFAAYVAHELRTPLATQRALLEFALSDATMNVSAWREIGADTLEACLQQERLLEACLTLTQSRTGLQRSEPVDLAAVTAKAVGTLDLSGLEQALTLGRAWTRGDANLVERLVCNLVSNAVQHNVEGGRVEITTRTNRTHAVLSVTNTGAIVPPGDVDRLFRPFQQLAPNTNTRNDRAGLGLGLAIVRAIADAHHALLAARARAHGGLAIDVAFQHLH